ncbi:ABC transporter ATP-binding protein [Streptomyces sp. PSKA54]|uniref:ABC transporter ATP-binding protein n=1 Tax=Streptomyces himalayensis subsp. aureolus TaxID=2758039 RepID=A0A7W2D406_9ACTN|nr:ABC transporter ATP-binding protein [Streptomyces himalayensis]MBA4864221.1 ABC transporter ATP-binding protein [Streptomyces himalayensis subsp. aureolus]
MSGAALAGDLLPTASPAEARRAAFGLIRREKGPFSSILLFNSLATVAGLAGPWLFGRIVNAIEAGAGNVHQIDRLAVLLVVFALLQITLTRYARYLSARFGERISAHVREQFLARILGLEPATVERVVIGDLTARGAGDVRNVAMTMSSAAPDVLVATVQALLILTAVFLVDPLLGTCGVVGLLGIVVATRWYLKRARSAYLDLGDANSALAEELVATVSGARTVEALSLEQRRLEATDAAIERARRSRLRTLTLRTVLYPTIDISYFIPIAGVLLVGAALYEHGVLSLGAVVTCVLYLRQLAGPLETMEIWIDQLQSCAASFARLEGLSTLPRSRPTSTDVPADDRIEVLDVHYAYDGGPDVLHGVNLTVRSGERLAIVGRSGAGKSTLGRLLAGIDTPLSGSVTVGGVPVAALPPEQLRRQIILVTQEHHVLQASVRENLLIAKPSASDDELCAAIAAVGARWLDDLPDGLDTELSPTRHRLDAGQAQQIALARVVLADPHTVILDEATALLDPTTARDVERALSSVLKGRTVLAIAHRLHTAHDADRVAVMEGGRVLEIGRHDDLVASGGAYADLWHSWHGDRPRPSV